MTDINTKYELMAQDINYIKNELKEIKEFMRVVVEQKADKAEVEKLAANQSRIAWIIITAVAVAVLGLVIKSSTL